MFRKLPKNKKKVILSFSGRIPCPQKSSNIHPHLLQAQPALALLLLVCYCGSTTMCRGNGNCVDPISKEQANLSTHFVQMIFLKTFGLYGRYYYLESSHVFHQKYEIYKPRDVEHQIKKRVRLFNLPRFIKPIS